MRPFAIPLALALMVTPASAQEARVPALYTVAQQDFQIQLPQNMDEVPLRDYFEGLILDLRRDMEQRFDTAERALLKAEASDKQQLDDIRGISKQLEQAAQTYPTQDALGVMNEKLEDRLKLVEIVAAENRSILEGQEQASVLPNALWTGGLLLVVGVVATWAGTKIGKRNGAVKP